MKNRDKVAIFVIFIIMFLTVAAAHVPKLVLESPIDSSHPLRIEDIDTPQIIHGELEGNEEFYEVYSEENANVSITILVPKIKMARMDFKIEIVNSEGKEEMIESSELISWVDIYEPYTGETYLKGPSMNLGINPGSSILSISNYGNHGKYAIYIGEGEGMSISGMAETIRILPKLKEKFFEKPKVSMFFSAVWSKVFIIIIMAGAFIGIGVALQWRRQNSKRKKEIRNVLTIMLPEVVSD